MKRSLILMALFTLIDAKSLVIYNKNLALVTENREFTLKKGDNEVILENFPKSLVIDSLFVNFNDPLVKLYSQTFLLGKNYIQELLKSNLHKEVSFLLEKRYVKGELVKIDPVIMIKSKGSYFLVKDIRSIIFKELPNTKRLKPYLKFQIDSQSDKNVSAQIKYLMRDISWSSKYNLFLNKKKANINCWATIKNFSKRDFKDVNITLLAGDINVNEWEIEKMAFYKSRAVADKLSSIGSSSIKAGAIRGYYKFQIPFRVDLPSDVKKNILLMEAKNINYKNYALSRSSSYYRRRGKERLIFRNIIEFKNSKENNLGKPLSRGQVRVYENGIFLGEGIIGNTPKNESIKIDIGKFFDIVGESRIVKYSTKQNYRYFKKEYEIKNRSTKDIEVRVVEDIPAQEGKVKFQSSCSGICSIRDKSAFLREYIIKLPSQKSYKFYSEYEIFYKQ